MEIEVNREIIARANEIVAKNLGEHSHCTLALIEPDGYPTISTISAAKADGILPVYIDWLYKDSKKDAARKKTIGHCRLLVV